MSKQQKYVCLTLVTMVEKPVVIVTSVKNNALSNLISNYIYKLDFNGLSLMKI